MIRSRLRFTVAPTGRVPRHARGSGGAVQTSTLFKHFPIVVSGRTELGSNRGLRPFPAPLGFVAAAERLEGLRPERPRFPIVGVQLCCTLEGSKRGLRSPRLEGDGTVLPPHLRLPGVEADGGVEAREGFRNPP